MAQVPAQPVPRSAGYMGCVENLLTVQWTDAPAVGAWSQALNPATESFVRVQAALSGWRLTERQLLIEGVSWGNQPLPLSIWYLGKTQKSKGLRPTITILRRVQGPGDEEKQTS
jgi:hypothetical protein